jgi:hypothetical protein
MEQMRGPDGFTESMFRVLKLDDFVPKDPVASDSHVAQ